MMALAGKALAYFGLSPSALVVGGIMAAGALVVAGGIWKAGYNYADAQCGAAAARAELAAVRKDQAIEREARAQEQRDLAALKQTKEQDDEKHTTLLAELAKRTPAGRCDISGPDAQRLR